MLSLRVLRFLFVLFVFLVSPLVVRSQDGDDCPMLVEEALALTAAVCDDLGRNQACYGNQMLLAEARAEVPALAFEQPGDRASIGDIDTLHLSPMDLEQRFWGVSLMALQANLPDTLPGQNVIVILFGDVDFQAQQRLELAGAIRAGGAVNLRDAPSTSGAVLGAVPGATALVLDGRNVVGDWFHVRLASGEAGWIFAELVEAEGDTSALTVGNAQQFAANPSAFSYYLRTGIGDAPCAEAPSSGIIIRTPEGAGQIALSLNEVSIRLGSTAYFTADVQSGLQVFTLDGEARVESSSVTRVVSSSLRTSIPLNEQLGAAGVPNDPIPFTPDEVSGISAPLGVIADGTRNQYVFPECVTRNGPIIEGQLVEFVIGNGCWETIEQAQVAFDGHSGATFVDGEAIATEITPPTPNTCRPNGWAGNLSALWTPTAGTHTVTVQWSGPVENFEHSCEVTVYR